MLNKVLRIIMDRILNEQPIFGSIIIRFYFHEGRFVKYDFEKTETTVINKGENIDVNDIGRKSEEK